MAMFRTFPVDKAWPNAIDLRKAFSGILAREGLIPDPISTDLTNGIAYANGSWNVGCRLFTAVSKRGGAPYSQAYGSALGGNDAAGTGWTVNTPPGSGSRVDRLWVRFTDPTQGESLTTPGGETVARAVPVFGYTPGTPGIAALPAGAVEIAQVSVPSGAGSIAGATITQTFKFAQLAGGRIYVRTTAERDALTDLVEGDVCVVLADDNAFEWVNSTVGWVHLYGKPVVSAFTPAGIYSVGSPGARAYHAEGRVNLDGKVTSSSATFVAGTQYNIGSIPAALAPGRVLEFACPSNVTALARVIVATSGAIDITLGTGFTGALDLSLAGCSWAHKGLLAT